MKYLNQFHKESEEKKARKLEEWKNQPLAAKEASEVYFRLYKDLNEKEQ